MTTRLGDYNKRQLHIAKELLKRPDRSAILGGPSHKQLREIIRQLTGKHPKTNPRWGKLPTKTYIVRLHTGTILIAHAPTKRAAKVFADAEMIKEYGKVKAVDSITEATPEDMAQYPFAFRGQAERLNPDLSRDEKDVLVHASQGGGAVYTGKDKIYWISMAMNVANKGLVRYNDKEHAFVLTRKGRAIIRELGLGLNPGTKWHVDRADDLRKERQHYLGKTGTWASSRWDELNTKVLENELAADASRRLGMNPEILLCPNCKRKGVLVQLVYSRELKKYVCAKCQGKFKKFPNPGAVWHEKQYDESATDHRKFALEGDIRNMDMALGRSSAHMRSHLKSQELRMPNPSKKGFFLPLALISGLAWLIWKNRKS